MKTYNEKGVYYQTLPYNARVIYDILWSRGGGIRQAIKFLQNSRWSEGKARRLAERKNVNAFRYVKVNEKSNPPAMLGRIV